MKKTIRLGTRGSPLALIQAETIKHLLLQKNSHLSTEINLDIIPIRTTGDWKPEHKDRRFVEMGGNKGLFTKEIEEALLSGHIDMAIHSMKDVSSTMPKGLTLGAIIARHDPRDAFIGRNVSSLSDLPTGAIVGTSSLRRQAQVLAQRPDLRVVPLRGNVETRLKKLEDGMADATLLAVAGMARLGVETRISSILPPSLMLPAAGQGALGVQICENEKDMVELLSPLNDVATFACVTAERAVMRAVDGTCNTPAAAYATISSQGILSLEALVARADGSDLIRLSAEGSPAHADKIGEELGQNLRNRSPKDLFAA